MPAAPDDSFKLSQFGGMLPAWDDHFLPDSQAASSLNGYLFSGALDSWRVPKLLHTTALSHPGYVYRLPNKTSAIASATLTFIANASEGDKITLGEEIYKFTATVTNAYDVKIGAASSDSATNLFRAFTFNNGGGDDAGTLYGTGTVANPAIDQTSPTTKNSLATNAPVKITVVAPDFGAAYNSTLVGSTSANLAWTFNAVATSTFLGGANASIETDVTSTSTWLEFSDPDTDVVRSPVVDDQFDRYYMASASVAPQYNTRERIEAGLPPWLLGVPAPGCTPTVTVDGGGNTATLGFNTSTSANSGTPGANIIYLVPVTPAGAMILNDITAVPTGTNATANFVGVVYSDLNGSPHEILNVALPVQGLTGGTPVASAFTNPSGLLMNVQYWIGFACDTAVAFQFANDTGTTGVVSLNTYSNGPPPIVENLQVGFGELQVWGDMTSSSVLDARSYVYTYVTEYGEESPPSPPTVLFGWANGTWTVGLFQPPPDQLGVTRNIKTINLYRTITAQSGATTYFFVATFDVTTETYVDTITDDIVATNNQLQSQLWSPPPEGLQGFVVMPNGIMAAWQGNEIWFCEPFRPHAWPASYVQTSEYPIVGLGVTGNAVIAATQGAPYVVSGVAPSQMSALKIQMSEPCHSRKSVIGNNDGVYYCSRNGLILVNAFGSVQNVTESWITREKWQQLTPQSNLCAVFLASAYFAFQRTSNAGADGFGQRGFTVELGASDANSFGIWPQPGGHRLGFQLLLNQLASPIAMVETDPWSAVCLVVAGNSVNQIDFTDPAPTLSVLDWTSKLFQQKTKKNFAAMRIAFTVPPGTPAQNPVRKEDDTDDPSWLQPLPSDRYGYILIYSGDILVTTREIRVPQEILRILSGFKHETWQVRVVSRVKISGIQMGTSVKALAHV
jgi:hypothetical protein